MTTTKHFKIQRFEIYGETVSMQAEDEITLKQTGENTYEDEDGWDWSKVGLTWLRGGWNEHGFMVLEDYDEE